MIKFDPQKHHRRSIRLKGYDYAQEGAYFVTIVTRRRECLFGEIVNKEMRLSPYGEIVQKWWEEIPVHFPNVETGAFVIMPNHVHGIIYILDGRGTVIVPEDNGENTISQNNDMPGINQGRRGTVIVPEDDGENMISQNNDMPGINQERRYTVSVPKDDGEIKIPEIPVPEDNGENTISQNNHVVGITQGGKTPPLRKPTLGQIVAYFKYQSTKEMNKVENAGVVTKFWQRNYYEHIIRSDKDLQNKTDYIEANPLLWDDDDENPVNGRG